MNSNTYELPSLTRIEVALDEAGRGSLIHDVVAAAVIMPSTYLDTDIMFKKIKDSKKCTPKRREELRHYIETNALAWGVGVASSAEIDERNILQATYLAMHRALQQVWQKMHFDHICVDGNGFKAWGPKHEDVDGWVPFTCIPKGDATRLDIAAASILAKTHRDEMIVKLAEDCPDLDFKYGIKSNKGYGTAKHTAGIKQHGLSEYHRKSFVLH